MTVVLGDETDGRVVVEPEDRMAATLRAVRLLKEAATVGELRRADLPPWAREVVETSVDDAEDDGATITDDTTWTDPSDVLIESTAVPIPDEYSHAADWLGEHFLREHADYVHATSPMDIDRYRVRDRDSFFAALKARGFALRHRPGLMDEFRASM